MSTVLSTLRPLTPSLSESSMGQDAQMTTPPPPPSSDDEQLQRLRNPRAKHTTRNQPLQVQVLFGAGLKYQEISIQTDLTLYQVRYAVRHQLTPIKRTGRPCVLTKEEVQDIIAWVCSSRANRRAS